MSNYRGDIVQPYIYGIAPSVTGQGEPMWDLWQSHAPDAKNPSLIATNADRAILVDAIRHLKAGFEMPSS